MSTKLFPTSAFSDYKNINAYESGQYYKKYVLEKQYYPYQYDGWVSRKYYGVKDQDNNIIYPRQTTLVEYYNNSGNSHKNIDFVVDAYKDFKKYQEDLLRQNKINNVSIFTKLNVGRSTDSLPDLYLKDIGRLYDIFVNTFLNDQDKRQIVDIFSFMKYIIKYISLIAPATAFNRSTFITSKFVPPTINGLTISFENIAYDMDYAKKANLYISDPHFDHFIVTAAKFGFFVDRNFPYNIVADLESAIMKEYARSRGYISLEDIFNKCYFKAYKADLDSLKNVVLGYWNSYCFSTKSQIINANNLTTHKVYYNQLNMETFEQLFNINWQIRLYLYTRILEDRVHITQNKFESLYNESTKINKFFDTENALLFINQKVEQLKTVRDQQPTYLTSEDLRISMLTQTIDPLPVEGLTF